MSNFISLEYFSSKEIKGFLKLAAKIKRKPAGFNKALAGKNIGLLFEKPSLRTKTAFYIGALQLGAGAIYYTPQEVELGKREQICDIARTTSGYLDSVVLRTFSHDTILEFAKFSKIPVINGLSDLFHPSQVLADMLTILELKGGIKGLKVAYIGDGNNVCNSLIYCFSILGGNLNLAVPEGYAPSEAVLGQARSYSKVSGAKISLTTSVQKAASNADVLYTDAWISMGKEKESGIRKKVFKNFQINDKMLKQAKKNCIVMHCLPAHRGEEVAASVIDSSNSIVMDQAENRLHVQKAILVIYIGGKRKR